MTTVLKTPVKGDRSTIDMEKVIVGSAEDQVTKTTVGEVMVAPVTLALQLSSRSLKHTLPVEPSTGSKQQLHWEEELRSVKAASLGFHLERRFQPVY